MAVRNLWKTYLRIFMYMYLYTTQQPVCEFSCTCISTRHNNLYVTRTTWHNKFRCMYLYAAQQPVCEFLWYLNWSFSGISQTHWSFCRISNFSIFDYDFTKKQHDQFDCQQFNTTTNHIHPKSFTLESVTWTYMYMLWDTTVKKKSEILKCHQYLGFLFFFLWIYMWRQQYIIICILIPNRV